MCGRFTQTYCLECDSKDVGLIFTHRSAEREGIAKFPKY
ncbi:hypothetical protein QBD00_004847 [Ochrobactrum sp. AN78]|nr:hypothetical protein [Ochrobactrum sp. AN78]